MLCLARFTVKLNCNHLWCVFIFTIAERVWVIAQLVNFQENFRGTWAASEVKWGFYVFFFSVMFLFSGIIIICVLTTLEFFLVHLTDFIYKVWNIPGVHLVNLVVINVMLCLARITVKLNFYRLWCVFIFTVAECVWVIAQLVNFQENCWRTWVASEVKRWFSLCFFNKMILIWVLTTLNLFLVLLTYFI